jgi:hypothetical protein
MEVLGDLAIDTSSFNSGESPFEGRIFRTTWEELERQGLVRRNQKRRLQLSTFDRLLWVWLSGIWADWRSALRIVKPETVIAWHRKSFRLYWSWKSRARQGRPSVPVEVRELIRRMSAANPLCCANIPSDL